MEDLSKFLNLSIDATQMYLESLGKFPLNFNEICLLKPDFSKDKIEAIINELKERNLLKVFKQSLSLRIDRYFIIPPFKMLRDGLIELKKFIEKDEYAQKKIEAINENIFLKQDIIEYDTIFKEFLNVKQNIENYINLFKKDSEVATTKSEENEEDYEILKKTEQELKNIMNSELASIVVALLQLKTEIKDKITEAGINNSQWDIIKNSIKDVLVLHTHEKAKELNDVISEEFKELSLKLKPKSSSLNKNQHKKKIKNFEILNKLQEDIEVLNSDFISKIKNLKIILKELEKTVNLNMSETFQALLNEFSINIEFFDQFLNLILKNYLETNLSNFEKFYLINNKSKFKEEISLIIRNSKNFVFVIIPKLEDYINVEDIKNSAGNNLQIKIASTDSYESDIVKEILLNENIEFRRYNIVNIIGINGDNENVIIGTSSELEKDAIFISSNYIPLINLFNFALIKKWDESKPPINMILINHINNITENIDALKGNEISTILKEISDIIVNIEGISLDTLEIKLLTSKLKQIDKPLENDFKTQIIEKIKKLKEAIK